MAGNLLILAVFSVFAVVLVYATYLSAREWSVLYCLNRYGINFKAKVEDLKKDTQGRGDKYYILYRFYVDEVSYENKQQISKKHYNQFGQSKEVSVKYLSLKPSVSSLAGSDFDNTYRDLTSYVAFAAVIIIPPAIAIWIISFIFSSLVLHNNATIEKKKKRK